MVVPTAASMSFVAPDQVLAPVAAIAQTATKPPLAGMVSPPELIGSASVSPSPPLLAAVAAAPCASYTVMCCVLAVCDAANVIAIVAVVPVGTASQNIRAPTAPTAPFVLAFIATAPPPELIVHELIAPAVSSVVTATQTTRLADAVPIATLE